MNIRQEFEAWAIDHGYDLDESKIFGRLYHCDESIRALQVWQAGTSRQEAKIKALEQAIAQEQETKPLLPNCFNCKHSETPCNSATCRDCKHAYSSIDNWEPKP